MNETRVLSTARVLRTLDRGLGIVWMPFGGSYTGLLAERLPILFEVRLLPFSWISAFSAWATPWFEFEDHHRLDRTG